MTTDRSLPRRPLHLGGLLAVSTATYAVTLAGVTGIQSATDRAVIESRRPGIEALDALVLHDDQLADRLDSLTASYQRVAAAYGPMVEGMETLATDVDGLSTVVARIERSSANLPSRLAVPRSPRSVMPAQRPSSHATTGASGAP